MTKLIYQDRAAVQLANALSDAVTREALVYAARDLQPVIDAAVAQYADFGRCSGEQACQVLEASIKACTSRLEAEAAGYVGLRWLWLLRRMPESFFKGQYSSSAGYDASLAEVIAGRSTGASRAQITNDGIRDYPLDATVARRVARYCAGVLLLSQLHREYRWAAKGGGVEFNRGQFPDRIADPDLDASVALYDTRAERGGAHGRMGTEVFGPTRSTVELREVQTALSGDPQQMFFRLLRIQPAVDLPVPAPGAAAVPDRASIGVVRARYLPLPVPLSSLDALVKAAPAAAPKILDDSAAALLFLLFASTVYAMEHRGGLAGMLTTGYLVSDEAFLRNQLDKAFANIPPTIKTVLDTAGVGSSDAAISLMESMRGNAWPLSSGPILYRDGEFVAFDILAASKRLEDSVVYPRVQGDVANVRSEHFELRVQEAIDTSKYAPPQAIRELRGRTLKLNGRPLTDVDAIALVGTSLLLVSCKSVIYSPEYDAGDHRAVRSAADTIRKGQKRSEEILKTLRDHPKGDNYDLRGYSLVGALCTPSVVWIELGPCTEVVLPDLRYCVSLGEFQEWLGR